MSIPARFDVELALLIRCAAPNGPEAMRQQAARLLNAGIDENRLYDIAAAHQMTMLLYRGLMRLDGAPNLKARLEAEMVEQAVLYEFVYPQQLEAVLDGLHTAGVRTLLLKGHALGQTIYQQPVLRPYSDFDILIPPDRLDTAAAVLKQLGYSPDDSTDFPPDYHLHHHHDVPYLHPQWLPVELHQRLVTSSGLLHVDMDAIWANAQPAQVGAVTTLTLLPEHLLIYLSLHMVSNHLFDIGLRALADAHAVVAAYALDWSQVVAASREWGCKRQVYLALRLVSEIYDDTVPKDVLQALCPQGVAAEYLDYCLSNMLDTSVAGLKKSSGLAEVWQTPDPARRWRQITARLFPSSAEIAAEYGLRPDDWRRWLYYPRWQGTLMRRHLANLLGLVRADPALVESARQEKTRREVMAWVSKE